MSQKKRCDEGIEILSPYASNLESLYDKALTDIRIHLYSPAEIVNLPRELMYHKSNTDSVVNLTRSDRILEMKDGEILQTFKSKTADELPLLRGFTWMHESRIYLREGNWCIKTIYHELLHICSRTSSPNREIKINGMKHKDLFEGLTEVLAGYILSKIHPQSYHNCWVAKGPNLCSMTYYLEAALWATLCSYVPLSHTFEIYFNEGTKDWNQLMNEFERRIRLFGYPNFSNPFDNSDRSGLDRLEEECIRIMGNNEFESRYSENKKHVDFDLIRL